MQIENVSEPIIAVRRSQYPEDKKAEFLLVGRSNVGKSSFINTLIERKNFARTSSKPGKTQTLNFYKVNDAFYLVDVPGYGYASVSKDTQKKFGLMIEEYLKERPNLKHVFMLIDYRHKPTEDDCLMYEFLKYYNLDITIVATKYDKVSKNNRIKQDKIIKDTLKFEDDEFITFSTVTKKGRTEILSIVASLVTINVMKIRNNSFEDLLETKIQNLESAAIVYGQENPDKLTDECTVDEYKSDSCTVVTVKELIDGKYFNSTETNESGQKDLINNVTNKSMKDDKIQIYRKNNSIYAKYLENNVSES